MYEQNLWDNVISRLPNPHILQSWEWGVVKSHYGWQVEHIVWVRNGKEISMMPFHDAYALSAQNIQAAAMILSRTVRIGWIYLRILYAPKGPLLDWQDQSLRRLVLRDLFLLAQERKALFIKIDPDVVLGTGISAPVAEDQPPLGHSLSDELISLGWMYSPEQVQFKNTVVLDLTRSEDQILAAMKQKTRYNLRLSERKGVLVRAGDEADIPLLYEMYAQTSIRDGFVIREREYYETVWRQFVTCGLADILIAQVGDEPIAALILFSFARKSWYFYGMSSHSHREKMPNYLLQWQAIRLAKSKGSLGYDLWGAPEIFDEDDPLWGVFKFKEGLGGTVVRHIGAWDRPIKPLHYRLYLNLLPRILDMMRQRGRSQTRQQIGI